MDVRFLGTGGAAGWPEPRRPSALLVDGRLRIDPGQPPAPAAGYRVAALPGGWEVTGPDGGRLLVGAPMREPRPEPETGTFGLVVVDLLASAAQLGWLRSRGLVPAGTTTALLSADHRVTSEAELARRSSLWQAMVPGDGDTLRTAPAPGHAAWPKPLPHRTLILGGARSGKSREAELRLAAEPRVTYLATGPHADGTSPGGDLEWAQRVAAHQARRPPWWQTAETTDLAGALRRLDGAVLVDGIGTWLAAAMDEAGSWDPGLAGAAGPRLAGRLDELVAAWRQTSARVVAVSDEVGSGVVPATPAGRQFRDQLGWLNQRLAAESEQALLVVAGRVAELPT
jgi:adenosylcobinamide kinase / adenosylcobinamide-phosphate guanylyltransferase